MPTMRWPRKVSPSASGVAAATIGLATMACASATPMFPVGTSAWNTVDRMSCSGLPFAPTTRSTGFASRARRSSAWWVKRSRKVIVATPRASIATLSAVSSGRLAR